MRVTLTLDPEDFHPQMQPDPPTWISVPEVSHEIDLDGDPDEPEEDDPAMLEEVAHQKEMMHDVLMAEWERQRDEDERKERGE